MGITSWRSQLGTSPKPRLPISLGAGLTEGIRAASGARLIGPGGE